MTDFEFMTHQFEDSDSQVLVIHQISSQTTPEALLTQSGWFYLNEVFQVLDPDETGKYKLAFKLMQRVMDQGGDPFQTMGRKKFGGRVAVQMERFAPWYRTNPLLKVRKLNGDLPFSDLMAELGGYFRLSELCRFYKNYLPYSYSILKRQADKIDDPEDEMGVFKYDTTYIVHLPTFRRWLDTQMPH